MGILQKEVKKGRKPVKESSLKEFKYTYTASVKDKSGKGIASVKGIITATDEKDAKGKVGEILTIDKGYNQDDIKDVSVKLKESLNEEEVSFEEISFMMESAEDYDDMYEAANLIADPSLREEVLALIDDCEQDSDDIDVCYSIVTSDLIDDKINEPNVIKESVKLNEGPGAGYTIDTKLDFTDVKDIKVTKVEEAEYSGGLYIHFTCDATGIVKSIEAKSYDHSVKLDNSTPIDCKLTSGIIETRNSEIDINTNKYILSSFVEDELLTNIFDISIIYGGGYSHSKYDGTICRIDDNAAIESMSDLVNADIKITDASVIDYIDNGVQGNNTYTQFTVFCDDEEAEFDSFEDAIDYAKKHDGVSISQYWYEDTFDGDSVLIDSEKVWPNSLPESYGGAYDIDENEYFTKEEITDFAEAVKDEVEKDAINSPLTVTDVYMTNNNFGGDYLTIFIEDFEGNEYDYDVRIDMRKIKKPSDLYKYKDEFVNHFYNQFCLEEAELDESLDEVDDYGSYYVKTFVEGTDMDTLGFNNESNACYWAEGQVKSGKCDQACVYDTETDECLYEYDKDNINESIINEDSKKPWGEKAYNLNEIISSMNDEEAYYGGWLYIWPDGEDLDQACYDFGTKEEYEELETSFKKYYRAYHKYGLYTSSKRIEDMAHAWDEKLGLPPIKNYYEELN